MGGGGLSNLFNHLQVMPAQRPSFYSLQKIYNYIFCYKVFIQKEYTLQAQFLIM